MELLGKLEARGTDSRVAAEAVAELERDGLQSDRRYAEASIRKAVRRGQGIHRLSMDLRRQGAEDENARAAMGEVDWDALIATTYTKKYRDTVPDSPKERAARMRFLNQRGFTQTQIRALFKRLGQTDE